MESIKDKVAVIGMGCTRFGEFWDQGPHDMIVDACSEALEDAGIEATDIQHAWFASLVSGASGARLSSAFKLPYIPITRVENFCSGGSHAFGNACYAVAAGVCDIALACGVEKLKDRPGGFAYPNPEPFDSSKIISELLPANMFAHIAMRYFQEKGWSYEEGRRVLAKIAVKNHHNGMLNPKAHLHREITEDDVLNAPMVVHPFGLYDCCGVSDGAAAAVICRADMAKSFRDDYVLVKAVSFASGSGESRYCDDYDYLEIPETMIAAKRAYEQAGIENPRTEVSLAEVHDCFTIHELILYEQLGFSPRLKASEDVEAETFTLNGELPINPDGGLKCFGHPLSATGLRMIYEVYKQLQGKAGPRQIKDPSVGLTHNVGGMVGFFNSAVLIFGNRN